MSPSDCAPTIEEISILRSILQASPSEADVLLGQLNHARITSNWAPGGSPSFDISVSNDAPSSRFPDGPLPVHAEVYDDQGEYTGELIVWMSGGFISALAYAWITDDMPSALPSLSSLRMVADS